VIRIAISIAAYEAIARTLPLGSVAVEPYYNERGERMSKSNILQIAKPRSAAEWVKRISAAWQKSVASIIETGDLLIKAKDDLDHGEFDAMVERDLPFKPSTARRLTKIAANECLSNRAHAHVLPPSWMTLYELTKLPAPELVARIEDGVINPKMRAARSSPSGSRNCRLRSPTAPSPMPSASAVQLSTVMLPQMGRPATREPSKTRRAAPHLGHRAPPTARATPLRISA
jgi:hypothetical protein